MERSTILHNWIDDDKELNFISLSQQRKQLARRM